MTIIAKEPEDKGFELCPAGTYQAVCYAVWDLGLQKVMWQDQETLRHKIRVAWEVSEPMADGRPFSVQKSYNLTLHEKAALRKDLESWRGRAFTGAELAGFDVEKLVGANCLLNVVHTESNGKTYANVASISPILKTMTKVAPTNGPEPTKRIAELQAEGQQNALHAHENTGLYMEAPPPVTDHDSLPF